MRDALPAKGLLVGERAKGRALNKTEASFEVMRVACISSVRKAIASVCVQSISRSYCETRLTLFVNAWCVKGRKVSAGKAHLDSAR
jgi:hypothetical protein